MYHVDLLVNQYSGFGYSLSWSMYHVDFDRLRAKCGLCNHWKFFLTQVWSMRPFGICDLMVQCGTNTQLSMYVFLTVLLEFAMFCELKKIHENVIKY